jgi:tetratricopeptide (TPR) repeat protein
MRLVVLGTVLWAGAAWALGPFEKNHPRAAEGLAAMEAGNYEEALRAFEEARRELPQSAALDYDRAQALARLGRLEEAKALYSRLAQGAPEPRLKQKAWYDLGNVHAQLSERQEAIAAYRRALMLDPTDADARHNLELVLRNLKPPQPPPPDGGAQDGGSDGGETPDAGPSDGGLAPDGGQDGGVDGGGQDGGAADGGGQDGGSDGGQGRGSADGGPGDAGTSDGGQDGGEQGEGEQQPGDGGEPQGGRADAGQQDGGGEGEGERGLDGGWDAGEETSEVGYGDGGVDVEELERAEAERLLDAMRQNEKNLQLWRFQRKKRPRNAEEKDW